VVKVLRATFRFKLGENKSDSRDRVALTRHESTVVPDRSPSCLPEPMLKSPPAETWNAIDSERTSVHEKVDADARKEDLATRLTSITHTALVGWGISIAVDQHSLLQGSRRARFRRLDGDICGCAVCAGGSTDRHEPGGLSRHFA